MAATLLSTFFLVYDFFGKQAKVKNGLHVIAYSCMLQVLAVFLVDMSGVLVHMYEEDFDKSFDYPLKGDIRKYMEQLRLGKELDQVYLVTFKNGPFPASFLYFWSFQTNITIYRSI